MTEPLRQTIQLNFDDIKNIMHTGIRRASSFVRLGLDDLDQRGLGDFNLAAGVEYRFWPEVISEADRSAVKEEYKGWLVGNCLRELDLFYGLFLDKIWFALELGELHGTIVRSDYMFDNKFSRQTNGANKHKAIAEKLGNPAHFEILNSISLARNALTHHAGVIRSPTDCNNDGRDRLSMKWLALCMVASRGGAEIVVDQMPFDTELLPGTGETTTAMRLVEKTIETQAGQRLELSGAQLSELCMFYTIVCDQVIAALGKFVASKGIPMPDVKDPLTGDSTPISNDPPPNPICEI